MTSDRCSWCQAHDGQRGVGASSEADMWPRPLLPAVVRGFLGDHHVVDVALTGAGGGDPDQPGLGLQMPHGGAAAVAHPGAQAADELMDHGREAALVRHAPLDPFGDQLVAAIAVRREVELVLEVAIAAALAHGADRAHAAILLERAPLVEDDLAR